MEPITCENAVQVFTVDPGYEFLGSIELNADESSDIVIDGTNTFNAGSQGISFNELNVNTMYGDVNMSYVDANSIKISSSFDISQTSNIPSYLLKSKANGLMYLKDVTVKDLSISTVTGNVLIENLVVKDGGSVNITTTSGTITLKNVGDGGDSYYISSESGYLIDITLNGRAFQGSYNAQAAEGVVFFSPTSNMHSVGPLCSKTDSWRKLKKLSFERVYDLQNSSRTNFYKKILFPKSNFNEWSSSNTTLPNSTTKEKFDENSVLVRFEHQLKITGIKTNHTIKPNFEWSCEDIKEIKDKYELGSYIILFPFCSPHLTHKHWPYYNELAELVKKKFLNKFKIIIAPGPKEINVAKKINALCVLNNGKSLNISQLSSLIKESSFVIANDTGPAHMAAHLNSKGITLFGKHTTAFKVSIERENFKAIQVDDLNKLSAEKVFEKISNTLN